MPIVEIHHAAEPLLAYNAPVNEKTKQVREMFKVDEETGYPEHYKWRGMAKLGPKFSYEDPYWKFQKHNPDEDLSTKIVILSMINGLCIGVHLFIQYSFGKGLLSQIHRPILTGALCTYGYLKYYERSLERASIKQHIYMDYVRKHPERFGDIQRYKFREIMQVYVPNR